MPLLMMGALPLYFIRLPDDDRALAHVIVGTMLYGRSGLFLRGAWEPDVWDALRSHPMFDGPIPIIAKADIESPGIVARIGTVVPAGILPRQYWGSSYEGEEWSGRTPGPNENAFYPLGTLVRYERAMAYGGNIPAEVADMVRCAVNGNVKEPWEQGLAL